MDRKINLKSLNPHIICNICDGYLIDATAITECLHTFCKSCLIKHLEGNTTCPTCNIVIHHSYPRQYINFDRTMQDIVYKLVPGLQGAEIEREKEFYRQRGLPYPKEILLGFGEDIVKDEKVPDTLIIPIDLPKDELITLCLECCSFGGLNNSVRKVFIRVPTKTTVNYLKKFVASKILSDGGRINDIDVFCNSDLLDKRDSLKFVYITKWKFDEVPLVLQCRPKPIS